MIAKTNPTDAQPTDGLAGNGRSARTVTRCISFEREAISDLQELAWAQNVPLDELVREAVNVYRRG